MQTYRRKFTGSGFRFSVAYWDGFSIRLLVYIYLDLDIANSLWNFSQYTDYDALCSMHTTLPLAVPGAVRMLIFKHRKFAHLSLWYSSLLFCSISRNKVPHHRSAV